MDEITQFMNEEWRDVPNYKGYYKVSSFGRVFSVRANKIMNLQNEHCGYLQLQFQVHNAMKHWKVHRLVALAFIPNPENKKCINHKDGNKKNNHVSNLEWCTHRENLVHAHRTGLKIPSQTGKSGRLHHRSRPCISINQTAIIEHESIRLCAKYLNTIDTNVHHAIRKGYQCKGHLIFIA